MNGTSSDLKSIPELLPRESAASLSTRREVAADDADKEASVFAEAPPERVLKKRAAAADHERAESFRDHFELIAIGGLWIVSLVFLTTGLIWLWHMLAPAAWLWLSSEQISKLQTLVTGGVLASLANGHVKRRLG